MSRFDLILSPDLSLDLSPFGPDLSLIGLRFESKFESRFESGICFLILILSPDLNPDLTFDLDFDFESKFESNQTFDLSRKLTV